MIPAREDDPYIAWRPPFPEPEIRAGTTALLIVDMQRHSAHREGATLGKVRAAGFADVARGFGERLDLIMIPKVGTAADVYASRLGVCRDYTHVAISFCRALNIPARYVFGYLPDVDIPVEPVPMDFAAWMEVWLADRWWTFDPRNNMRRKGRVVIGRGRDASDVAMATTFGGPRLDTMTVYADEVPA